MKKLLYLFAFLMVSAAGAQDFAQAIKSHLSSNSAALGLTAQDVESISVISHGTSKSMNVENVYVNQLHNGIEVYNSTSSFAVRNGQVVYSAPTAFTANLASRVNTTSPSLQPETAIIRAASALGLSAPSNAELLDVTGNTYLYSNAGISQNEIPVKLVYQPLEDGTVRLAWDLSIYLLDSSHYYHVRIDAQTGALLDTADWVVSCNFDGHDHSHSKVANADSVLFKNKAASAEMEAAAVGEYRVFPIPFRNPANHGTNNGELVSDPDDATASPFGWHDTDGVDGAEFTITRGNNVWAQEDENGNNGTGFAPDGGAPLVFDFDYNLPAQPADFQSAAITNLFYWNNITHDIMYLYGFDEENGNFQEDNYGNPGNGSDSVLADAQDGSGTNNANFATPTDGSNPRMQMFLWTSLVVGDILLINEGPLAGFHEGVPAGFGAPIPVPPLTEDIVVVIDDDSGGTSSDPNDACDVITNGTDLNGKIAILNRGSCEFGTKALNAQNAGAIAVIVKYIPTDGGAVYPFEMGAGADGGSVTIPAFLVPEAVGDAIIADINANGPLNGTIDGTNVGGFIDGDLDNEIIVHEYGHGVSNRLTGGPINVSCLNNTEQMGEGWSDYLGLVMTMQAGDTGATIRGLASYASQNPNGIRPTAYSTDFSINGATYGDIPGLSVPHGVGYVWATMLWDMTWALVEEYGWDPDIYNGTGGNNIALQLVMDGMKLQPCSPGFVDGRDAILEADMLANAGANQCLIWQVFADRGLGEGADQGSSNSVNDGTENFDTPTECDLGTGDINFDNNFAVYPNPSNGQINISSVVSLGVAKVSIFDMNGRRVYSQNVEIGNQASINATALTTGVYIIKIDGGNYAHTSKLIIQ